LHLLPLCRVAVRAEGTSRLGRPRIAHTVEPTETIVPTNSPFDERPSVYLPVVARRLHPRGFVGRNPDPLLDLPAVPQLLHLAADRLDLVLRGALAIDRT